MGWEWPWTLRATLSLGHQLPFELVPCNLARSEPAHPGVLGSRVPPVLWSACTPKLEAALRSKAVWQGWGSSLF